MSTTMYALTPMFRLKTVEVVGESPYDRSYSVTANGKHVHSSQLFATPNDAYKSGIDQVKNQRADLERRAADIDKRCANLETIRMGLRI